MYVEFANLYKKRHNHPKKTTKHVPKSSTVLDPSRSSGGLQAGSRLRSRCHLIGQGLKDRILGLPRGPIVVPFGGYYLESYKVFPKRNYFGAYGYKLSARLSPVLTAFPGVQSGPFTAL